MFINSAYLVLLAIIGLLLLIRKVVIPKQKKHLSRLVCLTLIAFSGFRYFVGTDYEGYWKMFHKIVLDGRYYNIEWGYYWLVKLVNAFGGTAQLVFLVFSIITIYFIYKFIEYFSENVELSWLVFICIGPYFLSTFNGMRQWLVVAVFAYSLRYIKEDNLKKYLALNIFGCLFHYSAVILLPMYWLLKIKNFSVVKIVACYVAFQMASIIGILDFVAERLYATSYLMGDAILELDWSYYLFFVLAVGFIVLSYVLPHITDHNKIFKNLNALSGLTVFLALTTYDLSNMIFTRFNLYFFIGYIILIPNVINRFKDGAIRALAITGVVMLSIAYFLYLTSSASDLLPYQTNFDLFTWIGG